MRKRFVIVLMVFATGLCFTNESMGIGDPIQLDSIGFSIGDSLIPEVANQEEPQSQFAELWSESELWTDVFWWPNHFRRNHVSPIPRIKRGVDEAEVDRALVGRWDRKTTRIPCSLIPSCRMTTYEIDNATVTAQFSEGRLTTIRVTPILRAVVR
jgi:hypothetical protein